MPAPLHTSAPVLAAAGRVAAAGAQAAPAERSAHLHADGISKRYGDRRVLSGVSFSAAAGDRIGLIGENGTGKSTLLRILAGAEEADAGTVVHAGSVALLSQELPYPDDAPLARVLDDAQQEARGALASIEELGAAFAQHPDDEAAASAYARALETAERLGAWDSEARRGDVLSGLGLGGLPLEAPVGRLSGGQRLRLALAAVLLRAPHTLLLDEPSNHLDDASSAYLEHVLDAWPGIVLVASHDRALLDAVTTKILDLDALAVSASVLADAAVDAGGGAGGEGAYGAEAPGSDAASDRSAGEETDDPGSGLGVRVWGTGYSAARAARRAEVERWRARYAAESEEREALLHEIEVGAREVNKKHGSKSEARITRKFYADKDARVTARRARNARVRLEALERERVRRPPEPLRFAGFGASTAYGSSAKAPGSAGGPTGATAGGPTGGPTGGSTGTTAGGATAGSTGAGGTAPPVLVVKRAARPGRLRQVSFDLSPRGRIMLTGPNGAGKSTLLEMLAGRLEGTGLVEWAEGARVGYLPQEIAFPDAAQSAAEAYRAAVGTEVAEAHPLSRSGLLAPRDVDRAVGALSVGQRRRVALAALVADPPDALLLDEPTNHLSLTLVEELEEALQEFAGAIVLASHDRWLRERWEGELIALEAAPAENSRG